jgi:hypothetical protein
MTEDNAAFISAYQDWNRVAPNVGCAASGWAIQAQRFVHRILDGGL